MNIPILKGEKIVLRGFTPVDGPDVKLLAGEFAVADTTLAVPHPYEDGMAEQWIAGHAAAYKNGQGISFAVTRESDGILMGAISLMEMQARQTAELGYWIGVPFWGQGYCTQAGRLLVAFAFDKLRLARLHAHHLTRNPASGRVLTKLGFRHQGTQPAQIRKWGKAEDIEHYELLRQ